MPGKETKKRQIIARHDDDLSRLREAERKHRARRKFVLGNLVMILGKRNPKTATKIIAEAMKLASRDYDRAELAMLAKGQESRSRIILLGALLLSYAERTPLDRRVFDALRPFARPEDRDLLLDVFVHYDRYRTRCEKLDTPEEGAARSAEKAARRRDSVRLAAIQKAARKGILLPIVDEDDDGEGVLEFRPGKSGEKR